MLALVFLVRAPYLLKASCEICSDNAIVGLMAQHIISGQGFPLFYYGQVYMGAAEAYLLTPFVALWGAKAWGLCLGAVTILAAFALLNSLMIRRLAGAGEALASLALIVLAPRFMTWFFTLPWGGYATTLLLGVVFQLTWLKLIQSRGWGWLLTAALLAGLGLWTSAFFVFFALPCAAASLVSLVLAQKRALKKWPPRAWAAWRRRTGVFLGIGGLIYLVYIAAVVLYGHKIKWHLGGVRVLATSPETARGLDLVRASAALALAAALLLWRRVEGGWAWTALKQERRSLAALAALAAGEALARLISLLHTMTPQFAYGQDDRPLQFVSLTQMGEHLVWFWENFVPSVLGLQTPWGEETGRIIFSLILAAVIWIVIEALAALGRGQWPAWLERNWPAFAAATSTLGLLSALTMTAAVIDQSSCRYLNILIAWWPFLMVWLVKRLWSLARPGGLVLVLFLAVFLTWSTTLSLTGGHKWRPAPPLCRWADLVATLENEGVKCGYAGYWLAYAITFLTDERLIISPGAEYDDCQVRYGPYARQVALASRKAYIFRPHRDDEVLKKVKARLRSEKKPFKEFKVEWSPDSPGVYSGLIVSER